MDKLIHDDRGNVTISNDGATIMRLLEVVHPAASLLVDVARSQDAEAGDGTTTVVLLAGELLRAVKPFVEDGAPPRAVARALRAAGALACARLRELAVPIGGGKDGAEKREMLIKCASTSLNSKLVCGEKEFFAAMVVDAVSTLDQRTLDLSMLGVKKVVGGKGREREREREGREREREFFFAFSRGLAGGERKSATHKKVEREETERERNETHSHPPPHFPPPPPPLTLSLSPGGLRDSFLVDGVAFRKTFSYAGFEMQPKRYENPRVLALNIELELKAEKDNAEVRLSDPGDYQAVVDAEW